MRVRTLPPKRSIIDSSSRGESLPSSPARLPGADLGASAEAELLPTPKGQLHATHHGFRCSSAAQPQ